MGAGDGAGGTRQPRGPVIPLTLEPDHFSVILSAVLLCPFGSLFLIYPRSQGIKAVFGPESQRPPTALVHPLLPGLWD